LPPPGMLRQTNCSARVQRPQIKNAREPSNGGPERTAHQQLCRALPARASHSVGTGRSPGLRILLLAGPSQAVAQWLIRTDLPAFVTAHSGGAATDSHRTSLFTCTAPVPRIVYVYTNTVRQLPSLCQPKKPSFDRSSCGTPFPHRATCTWPWSAREQPPSSCCPHLRPTSNKAREDGAPRSSRKRFLRAS